MDKLVDGLVQYEIIKSDKVASAMRKVDRGDFCKSPTVYSDCPQSIICNTTISAPHMHAYCLVSIDYMWPQFFTTYLLF